MLNTGTCTQRANKTKHRDINDIKKSKITHYVPDQRTNAADLCRKFILITNGVVIRIKYAKSSRISGKVLYSIIPTIRKMYHFMWTQCIMFPNR